MPKKLTRAQIDRAVEGVRNGDSYGSWAKKYDVEPSTIQRLCNKRGVHSQHKFLGNFLKNDIEQVPRERTTAEAAARIALYLGIGVAFLVLIYRITAG